MNAPITTSFEQFRATGRDVSDLRDDPDAAAAAQFEGATPGRVYADGLYIEKLTSPSNTTQWYLNISNCEWVTPADGDLEKLERRLYEFACTEGYLTPPPLDGRLRRQWVANLNRAIETLEEIGPGYGVDIEHLKSAIDDVDQRR